ncbi:MAG: hypothetical protein M3Y05_04115 [Gemmatimonadota bacterium]|nr:hypothetical protein [Gemmatimonadota bacterium]
MTTSLETEGLNLPALQQLVHEANALTLADRVTLLKALIPGVALEMTPRDFEGLILELRGKGERFFDALTHPGEGRAKRHTVGERDYEGR